MGFPPTLGVSGGPGDISGSPSARAFPRRGGIGKNPAEWLEAAHTQWGGSHPIVFFLPGPPVSTRTLDSERTVTR
jgi:hypothetical protein